MYEVICPWVSRKSFTPGTIVKKNEHINIHLEKSLNSHELDPSRDHSQNAKNSHSKLDNSVAII
jgi:hypothetical protein